MVGLRTRTEVSGMIPDNSKRPDVVYTSDSGHEIIADVVTCLPVLMSATTLNNLINRLPPNDRARLRTYSYQLIAATTTLGIARVIRACLPIRRDSSNRILPTPGDAIPSNGLPPRPPPGQYHPRSPNHRTTVLLPTREARHYGHPGSPPTCLITMSPSARPVASTTDRTPEGAVG